MGFLHSAQDGSLGLWPRRAREVQQPFGTFEVLSVYTEGRGAAPLQKYGANHIIGYANVGVDLQEPGATKWGWPAWNHVMSLLIATQSHLASSFVPSHRPGMQFMTRYSRFIWARDIRVVPPQIVQQDVQVKSAEELWWKQFVYERKTTS